MAAIDPKTLSELRSLMGDDLDSVFHAFIGSANQCLDDLSNAINKNDIHKIERSSHTLKGSSANIGAAKLSRLCAVIVEMARNTEQGGYENALGDVVDEYGKVESEITTLLAD